MSASNAVTNALRLTIQDRYQDRARFYRINVITANTPGGRAVTSAPPGFPDLVGCVDGRYVEIEVKAGRDRLTADQISHLAATERAGGIAIVAKEVGAALAELERKLAMARCGDEQEAARDAAVTGDRGARIGVQDWIHEEAVLRTRP